jgi:hypothetical protein
MAGARAAASIPCKSPAARIAIDALNHVFGFLSPSDRAIAKEVCMSWRRLAASKGAAPLLRGVSFAATAPLLDWAWERGWRPSRTALGQLATQVAARVRPQVLQWLLDHGMHWQPWTIAAIGRVRTLEWLKGWLKQCYRDDWLRAGLLCEETWGHSLEVIKWHHRNGGQIAGYDLDNAARTGSAGKFIWAIHHTAANVLRGLPNLNELYRRLLQCQAPRQARICMELLARKASPPHSCQVARDAACNGRYEVLMHICDRGWPINRSNCVYYLLVRKMNIVPMFAPAGPAELRAIDETVGFLSAQRQECCTEVAHHPDCAEYAKDKLFASFM